MPLVRPACLSVTNSNWLLVSGYSKFIKHQTLLAPEKLLLPDDKLTLLCTITIAGKSITSSGAQKPATCQHETNQKSLTEVRR